MPAGARRGDRATACKRCGRPILFVRNLLATVETWIPVEPIPDSEGSVCVSSDPRGRLAGWPISAQHPHDPRGRIYMPHPAICPVRPRAAGERHAAEPMLPLTFDDESEELPQESHSEIRMERGRGMPGSKRPATYRACESGCGRAVKGRTRVCSECAPRCPCGGRARTGKQTCYSCSRDGVDEPVDELIVWRKNRRGIYVQAGR